VDSPLTHINNSRLQTELSVKYIGMHLDRRLTLEIRIKIKIFSYRLYKFTSPIKIQTLNAKTNINKTYIYSRCLLKVSKKF